MSKAPEIRIIKRQQCRTDEPIKVIGCTSPVVIKAVRRDVSPVLSAIFDPKEGWTAVVEDGVLLLRRQCPALEGVA